MRLVAKLNAGEAKMCVSLSGVFLEGSFGLFPERFSSWRLMHVTCDPRPVNILAV